MSISPKLANSTPHQREGGRWAAQHDRLRYQPEVLRKLMADYTYQLKFVVTAPEDMAEIEKIVDETGADRSRVVLMPEGIDAETIRERARWLVDLCKREGSATVPGCTWICGAMRGEPVVQLKSRRACFEIVLSRNFLQGRFVAHHCAPLGVSDFA